MVIKSQKNIIDFIIKKKRLRTSDFKPFLRKYNHYFYLNISHRIKDKKIESKFIAKKGVEKNEVQNI